MANSILSAIEGLMRGICNQPQTREVVRVIPQEFDYDKLAEAIVRATEESKKKDLEKKDSSATVLSSLSTGLFILLGAAMIFVAVFIGFFSFELFKESSWQTTGLIAENVLMAIGMLIVFLCAVGLSVYCFKAAGEVSVEKDRNYIAAVASTLTSLVALVVAFVALFKRP